MKRKRKRQPKAGVPVNPKADLIARILAGLLATGAISGTGASYFKSSEASAAQASTAAAQARTETKVEVLEKNADSTERHLQEHDKALRGIDRRTIRMEETLRAVGDKFGVRRATVYGPDER